MPDPTDPTLIDTGTNSPSDTSSTDTSVAPIGSTGINDPSSVWYSGLLSSVFNTATQAGSSLADQQIASLLGAQTPEPQQTGAPGTSGTRAPAGSAATPRAAGASGGLAGLTSNKTLLYVGGGLVVLLLGWMLLGKK